MFGFNRKTVCALLAVAGMSGVFAAEELSGFAKAQQELKKRNPEAYNEIQKLAATDLEAAVAKMREAAGKNRIYIPRQTQQSGRRPDGAMRFGGGMRGGNRGGNRGGMRGGMGMNFFGRAAAEVAISEKYSAEAAELDKILIETEAKYAALAAKAGVELPSGIDNNLRRLRIAAPAEFAKIMQEFNNDRRAGFTKLNALAEKHGIQLFQMNRRAGGAAPKVEDQSKQLRTIGRPNMSMLRRKYPAEMQEYEKLRRENPQKAKDFLEQLITRDRGNSAKK